MGDKSYDVVCLWWEFDMSTGEVRNSGDMKFFSSGLVMTQAISDLTYHVQRKLEMIAEISKAEQFSKEKLIV